MIRSAPILLCLLVVSLPVRAQNHVDYLQDVKPLLLKKCSACHGSLRQRSGLRLNAGRLIHEGGRGRPGDCSRRGQPLSSD